MPKRHPITKTLRLQTRIAEKALRDTAKRIARYHQLPWQLVLAERLKAGWWKIPARPR